MITPEELTKTLSQVETGEECAQVFFSSYPATFESVNSPRGMLIFAALECAFNAGQHRMARTLNKAVEHGLSRISQ